MHIHFQISIFVLFFLGQFVHAWNRASDTIASKLNGITSYAQYMTLRDSEIMSRFLVITCIFGGWTSGGIYELIGYIAPSTAATLAAHPIPIAWWTAGLFGFLGDYILYFVIGLAARYAPGIRQEVPPTIQSAVTKEIDSPTK